MATDQLACEVKQDHEIALIELHGGISTFGEKALNTAYVKAVHENPDAIMLDFADVDYMNSAGIALVVGLMAQARKSGRRLLARGLSEHYQQIFQTTRLSDFITMV
jgi:anti-sigma B factor antagonist